jgi:hypothetical protein
VDPCSRFLSPKELIKEFESKNQTKNFRSYYALRETILVFKEKNKHITENDIEVFLEYKHFSIALLGLNFILENAC